MKTCFKCGQLKELSEFYSHPRMADGHLGKCKDCTKVDVRARERRMRDDFQWVIGERHRCRVKRKRYKCHSSPASSRKYSVNNPEKRKAHMAVANAIRYGRLTKPTSCQLCGDSSKRIQGHHWDYAKQLDVVWVCPRCHGMIHWKECAAA